MSHAKRGPAAQEGRLSPPEMLQALSQLQLAGMASDADCAVVLAAPPRVAWLLDACCVGDAAARRPRRRDAAADEGAEVAQAAEAAAANAAAASAVAASVGESGAPPHLVDLATEQARRQHASVAAWRERQLLRKQGGQPQEEGQPPELPQGAGGGSAGIPGSVSARASDGGSGSSDEDDAPPAGGQPPLTAVRLEPEEAFFLAHVLGCLRVFLPTGRQGSGGAGPSEAAAPEAPAPGAAPHAAAARPSELDDRALWRWCCAARSAAAARDTSLLGQEHSAAGAPGDAPDEPGPGAAALAEDCAQDFPARCAAYHHLRSKGWLPRPGRAYGCHYTVYAAHPAAAHSLFCALVVPLTLKAEAPGAPSGSNSSSRAGMHSGDGSGGGTACRLRLVQPAPPRALCGWQLDWVDVSGLQRLARSVRKQLLLLHVALPAGAAKAGPACLGGAAVEEVLVEWFDAERP
jgi:hypothetical protein